MPTPLKPTPALPVARRHLAFRAGAAVIALLLLVGLGSALALLTPWLALPDGGGHGWERTPALHLPADSAAALLMAATGLAALFLVFRPTGHPALASWTAITVAAMGVMGTVSAAIQGHDVPSALLFTLAWIAVLVVPFVLLHPDRAGVLRGMTVAPRSPGPGPARGGPGPFATVGLLVLAAAGLALAVGVVLWRLGGGVFESHLEDDVVGLALLGLSLALGSLLCLRRRTGWRALAWLLGGMGAYCVLAAVSIFAG